MNDFKLYLEKFCNANKIPKSKALTMALVLEIAKYYNISSEELKTLKEEIK